MPSLRANQRAAKPAFGPRTYQGRNMILQRSLLTSVAAVAVICAGFGPFAIAPAFAQGQQSSIGRGAAERAPAADRAPLPSIARDAASPAARPGSPNILIVLLDDVGIGASSVFGGVIPTPNYEALASQGLRYNRFHTTSICSSTRAALLTGRNHHSVNMGTVQNFAIGEPGYTSIIPQSSATLGQVLQMNGYSTAYLGKWHVTPDWEITPTGPYEHWPTSLGFDHFYGFFGAMTNQWAPALVDDRQIIEPPANDPSYILDRDLADNAIQWLQTQHSTDPARPFLLYLAPGSGHSPHQAPQEWIDRFKGQFDRGWDAMRDESFERMKALGVVPEDTIITPRPASIPSWESLSSKEKTVAARSMEVFAATLSFWDFQFGRVVDELKRSGEYENTLIVYADGDNGATDGGRYGSLDSKAFRPNGDYPLEYIYDHLDQMGGPQSSGVYAGGWGWLTSTPFPYMKTIASHLGGTRDGLVVSWPGHIEDEGGLRSQYLHVTDVAPTIYEAVGIEQPAVVDGFEQEPLDGVSFLYTIDEPDALSRHTRQYYEMFGNRAYYEDGWIASTTPSRDPGLSPDSYSWELYNLDTDFSQSTDLASIYPDHLERLKQSFEEAAIANHVYPLSSDLTYRSLSSLRPYVSHARGDFEFYRSEVRIPNQSFPNLFGGWSLSVDISIADADTSGTLISQGGQDGGWGLFLFNGRPIFVYRTSVLDEQVTRITSPQALAIGEHTISMDLTPSGTGRGGSATVNLNVNGQTVQSGQLSRTLPNGRGGEDTGIGRDTGTSLLPEYSLPFRFEGEMGPVRIHVSRPTQLGKL